MKMIRTFENNFMGMEVPVEKTYYFVKTLDNGTEMWMDELWAANNPEKVGRSGTFRIPLKEIEFSNGLIYQPSTTSFNRGREIRSPGSIVNYIW